MLEELATAELDPRELRSALGAFATGVTIICARSADGSPVGVTANSFSSVSLDPPLVLWSLGRRSLSQPVFESADFFSVHVLAAEQSALADRFAQRGVDKFAGLDWRPGLGGAPLLSGAAARFECRRHAAYDGGDHRIYLGRVLRFESEPRPTLAFLRGAYARCAANPPPSRSEPARRGARSQIRGLQLCARSPS